ncbi:putative AT-rich interactive domain-containing protein 4B [Hypsibius exemplaris]|uniref:AT-rich interactive domain-containing protein 4B n=1 Tax=Hypsibius exemplaris TaxID=2072580 RepID=A0A1W0WZR4_HYPEX|nr:putative AT-rich interactive domain-containing protein 4B [Hypsibius exemplaris]
MAPIKSEEPALLEPGTEVSAKFEGAFCEAKIESVAINVSFKARDPTTGDVTLYRHPDIVTEVKELKVQGNAVVRGGGKNGGGDAVTVTVLHIYDASVYTVHFNDGDVKTLKRSNIHLKSEKHFDQSISLDNLPLTQPEKIASGSGESGETSTKRKVRNPSVASGATDDTEDGDAVRRSVRTKRPNFQVTKKGVGRPKKEKLVKVEDVTETLPPTKEVEKLLQQAPPAAENAAKQEPLPKRRGPPKRRAPPVTSKPSLDTEEVAVPSSSRVEEPVKIPVAAAKRKTSSLAVKLPAPAPLIKESNVVTEEAESGAATSLPDYPIRSVVCLPQTGRKKCRWLPALVVHPDCRKKPKLDPETELRVRLFSNSNYMKVRKDILKPFSEAFYTAPDEDRLTKLEPDTALQYFKDKTLPPTWQATMFTPLEQRESPEDGGADPGEGAGPSRDDSDDERDHDEATRFMILWMRYRDESGHQDQGAPSVGGQTVDMYQLYLAVQNAGGFKNCTQEDKWEDLVGELDLPADGAAALKGIYQTYLFGGFENFFRNLGTSITDIRLGRKRHQHQQPEKERLTSAEPERHVQSPPPKRRKAPSPCAATTTLTSTTTTTKRGRGRPGTRKASTVATEELAIEIKEESPDPGERQAMLMSVASSSAPSVVTKRDASEEISGAAPQEEDEWALIRQRVAPDDPPIADPSVLRPGAIVEVLYRNQKGMKVVPYHARLLDNVGDIAYYVHYNSWNKRYDEWKPLSAILKVIDLQEVGSKQYAPTTVFQQKIRSKLRGREWQCYRAKLDRALALDDVAAAAAVTSPAVALAPSTEEPTANAKDDFEKDAAPPTEGEKGKRRKRSLSKSESIARSESVGSVTSTKVASPVKETEKPAVEPLPIPPATEREPEIIPFVEVKVKSSSPQPSTSQTRMEDAPSAMEASVEPNKVIPASSKSAISKPSMLIKVETVAKKPEKEKTVKRVVGKPAVGVAEKKSRAEDNATEEEKEKVTPKRALRMVAKFLPDVGVKKKPMMIAGPAPPIKVRSATVVSLAEGNESGRAIAGRIEPMKVPAVETAKSLPWNINVAETKKAAVKVAAEEEDGEAPIRRPKPGAPKKSRPASVSESSKSSSDKDDKWKPESTGAPKNSSYSKTASQKPESIPSVASSSSVSHKEESTKPEPPSTVKTTDEAGKTKPPAKALRKQKADEVPMPIPDAVEPIITAVPSPPASKTPSPPPLPNVPIVASLLVLPSSLVSASNVVVGKDGTMTAASLSSVAVDRLKAASLKPAKVEVKSSGPTLFKPKVPAYRERKNKVTKESDQIVDVTLKAPAFGLEHKAALERLGLPLDGSEGSKETIISEDEYGNFRQLIVEGVDLTDPDSLSGQSLTGTARIEAYEKNLNDTLLVMQLMIHRLATGYHILKRCDSIRQDLQDTPYKTDTKKAESGRSASEENEKTLASGGSRPKTGRAKQ